MSLVTTAVFFVMMTCRASQPGKHPALFKSRQGYTIACLRCDCLIYIYLYQRVSQLHIHDREPMHQLLVMQIPNLASCDNY